MAKNLFIGVGNALSVFVTKPAIRLIANQGPVQAKVQNDSMALLARKEVNTPYYQSTSVQVEKG
nr:DUF2345 domain-containing protein [uncultured Erwinia sp.]